MSILSLALLHPGGTFSWTEWKLYPDFMIGWLLFGGLYFLAIGPLRHRFPGSAPVSAMRVASFSAGLLIMLVALQGPMHELSDFFLFSAHMVQHLLVTLIMPPLLLKGLPAWLFKPALDVPVVYRSARFIVSPFIAFAIFNIVFALWHVPSFYQSALGRPAVHSLEHILFMSTAILTWWPIFSPTPLLPRLNEPLQMIYLFAQSLIPTVLGALITFADIVLYPYYASAPRVLGISVLDDQQGAGLLMWLGGASIVLFVLTLRFFSWMDRDSDEAAARLASR